MNQPKTNLPAKTTEAQVEYIPLGGDPDSKVKLSISIVKHYFASPTKSGKLPSDRDCVRFMLLCKSRALSPAEGDCFLIGYDGQGGPEFSLITAQQAFLKRAEVQPEYDGMESGVIVMDKDAQIVERIGDFLLPEDALLGAWATVHFKTRKHPSKERINLETFQKDNKFWKSNPAGMIVKCAESSALRRAFPTKLGGMYLREELEVKADAPTLTGTGEIDMPPVTVDTGQGGPPAETPNGKTDEPAKLKQSDSPSPQAQLQTLIEGAGYNFNDLQAWGTESGNIQDADSLPDYSAIKTADATRLLRAKSGLLRGIAMMKGEEAPA